MNDEAQQPLPSSPSSRAALAPPALDPALFEALGKRVVADLARHLATLRDKPIRPTPSEADLARALNQALPEAGVAAEEIVAAIERDLLPYPTGNGHPGFLAWVVAPPAPVAVLADLVATGMNMMGGGAAPLPTNLGHCVCRWLMELVGFPAEGSMGLLVGGGSMANLTGLAVARHWAAKRDGWNLREEGLQAARPALVLYASDEAHSCIQKSVELLGLGNANLRRLPTDGDYRLDMAALKQAIAADRAAGRRPFCVVGNAGTVNTGAVDPLDAIAELCAAEDLWFHIDGAYGALGVCDPEAAPRFTGMERADSLALDPHKWLSVPLDCGCILVRDRALQRETFSLVPPYLQSPRGTPGDDRGDEVPLPFEHGFDLSRGFRALKVWATLMHLGRRGLAAKIARNNALARRLAAAIEAAPDLELLSRPQLSIVCFRYRPPESEDVDLDALNQAVNERINGAGEFFFTPTRLEGRFAQRACILHYATGEADIDLLVRRVRQVGEEAAAEGTAQGRTR